jgi:hypothetical protein
MGIKLYGHHASGIRDNTSDGTTRDIPAFEISGMTDSFGGMAVCLYIWNPNSEMWEPMTQP